MLTENITPPPAKKSNPTHLLAVLAIHFKNSIAIHLVLNSAMMRFSNWMQSLTRKCENLHLKLKVTCVYIGKNSKRWPGIVYLLEYIR